MLQPQFLMRFYIIYRNVRICDMDLQQAVCCAVVKDSGDDPDVTNGIRIDGGEGIGRVIKPGLDQPVGSAAINKVPKRFWKPSVWS